MIKFSKSQYDVLSQMFGNGAVAWLTVGVIYTIFGAVNQSDKVGAVIIGLIMSIFFAIMAMIIARVKDRKRK